MIAYKVNPQLNAEEVCRLYQSMGWTNYSSRPEMLQKAIAHSLFVLAAFDKDRLVGLLRAVGDGYSIVFIQDILVDVDYQRQGIGRALVEKTLDKFSEVYQLHLMTDNEERTISFYESLGFTPIEQLGCVAYTYIRK